MKYQQPQSAQAAASDFKGYHVAPPEKEGQLRRKILTKLAAAVISKSGKISPAMDERPKSEHDGKLGQ